MGQIIIEQIKNQKIHSIPPKKEFFIYTNETNKFNFCDIEK